MRLSDNARICIVLVVTMLVIASAITVLARLALPRLLPPPLAVVDVTATVRQQQERAATHIARARSADERQQHLRHAASFGTALEKAIATLRSECRCTLVLREAIVAGDVPDLTPRLAALLEPR